MLTGIAERHPRDPRRDRRRLRRQDHRLSRAAGDAAGEEVRPAGEDGDDPRGSVPRHRPDLGLDEHGEDRRQEGRHDRRRRRAPSICRPARSRARRSAALRAAASRPTTSRTCLSVGYDVVSNRPKVAAYRAPGAPIGAFAVECVLDELAEARKMDPLELRLKNAAKQGTKAAHGPVYPRIGYIETLEAATSASALQGAARQEPGPRRRLRLLVQCRRRIQRAGQHQRGRHRRGHHGPSRTSAARAPRSPSSAPSCSASTTSGCRC